MNNNVIGESAIRRARCVSEEIGFFNSLLDMYFNQRFASAYFDSPSRLFPPEPSGSLEGLECSDIIKMHVYANDAWANAASSVKGSRDLIVEQLKWLLAINGAIFSVAIAIMVAIKKWLRRR